MRLTFLSFSLLHAMKICMVCIAAYGAKLRLKYNICNKCQKIFLLPKTMCTKNVYQIRVNFTRMDQSECFVSKVSCKVKFT